MTIGEKIKQKREELGLSQKELAEKVGLTNASVSNVEKEMPCNMQTIERLCEALGLKIDVIDMANYNPYEELSTDINKCCRQLDRVKRTLENLNI